MTITLLLLLSAGLLVMAYLLWTLHSRLRLLERMDATRKRDARDLSKMQGEVEHYFSFVSEQQHKLLEMRRTPPGVRELKPEGVYEQPHNGRLHPSRGA